MLLIITWRTAISRFLFTYSSFTFFFRLFYFCPMLAGEQESWWNCSVRTLNIVFKAHYHHFREDVNWLFVEFWMQRPLRLYFLILCHRIKVIWKLIYIWTLHVPCFVKNLLKKVRWMIGIETIVFNVRDIFFVSYSESVTDTKIDNFVT